MKKNLGKKARMRFTALETEYNRRYGMFPDYHYTELYGKHGAETAGRTVQANTDAVWNEMKTARSTEFVAAGTTSFDSARGGGGS